MSTPEIKHGKQVQPHLPGEVEHRELITSFIRTLSKVYLKTDRRTGTVTAKLPGQIVKWPFNLGYPAAMRALFAVLEEFDAKIPVSPPGELLGIQLDQWRADKKGWRARFLEYKRLQAEALASEPEEASHVYLDHVALPLLLGWYPGGKQQQPLDAVTPITLAWQAKVLDAAMRDALSKLATDLKENAIQAAKIGAGVGGVALAIASVFGVLYLIKEWKR